MLKQLNGIKHPGVTLSVPDSNLRVFTYLNFKNPNNQKAVFSHLLKYEVASRLQLLSASDKNQSSLLIFM